MSDATKQPSLPAELVGALAKIELQDSQIRFLVHTLKCAFPTLHLDGFSDKISTDMGETLQSIVAAQAPAPTTETE